MYWISEYGNHLKLTVTQTNKSTSCRTASEKWNNLLCCWAWDISCVFVSRYVAHYAAEAPVLQSWSWTWTCVGATLQKIRHYVLTQEVTSHLRRQQRPKEEKNISAYSCFIYVTHSDVYYYCRSGVNTAEQTTYTHAFTHIIKSYFMHLFWYITVIIFCHNPYVLTLFSVC